MGLVTVRVSVPVFLTDIPTSSPDIITDNPVMLEDDSVIVAETAPSPRPPALSQRSNLRIPSPPNRGKNPKRLNAWTPSPPSILPPTLSIGRSLPLLLYPITQAGGWSAKTTAEQSRSQALPALPLHRSPSNPRPELRYLKRRNGRSEGSLAREEWERTVYSRCAGRIPGCAGTSWGTLSGCCKNLKHKVRHTEHLSRTERYGQTRVDDNLDAVFPHYNVPNC